jgi:hypothetical protein
MKWNFHLLTAVIGALLSALASAQQSGTPRDAHSWDVIPAAFSGPACDMGSGAVAGADAYACDAGCRSWDLWGEVEFLMWWCEGSDLPPVVTTSPQGTPREDAGVLGIAGTSALFGGRREGNDLQVGGRVTLGIWLDGTHNAGIAGRFFSLEGDVTRFESASTGDPILARPFFNVQLGAEDAFLVAYPGVSEGSVSAKFTNNLYGAETYARLMMHRSHRRRVDLLAGYQFVRLDDDARVSSFSTSTDPLASVSVGTTFDVFDRFRGRNEFHGGVLGLQGSLASGKWSAGGIAKAGFGNMHQTVVIEGSQTIALPPDPGTAQAGGILAQSSNIGTYTRDRFAFVPEFTLYLKYHFTDCLSASVGYNLIWLSDVVRGADHIDRAVNLSQNPGPVVGELRPLFQGFVDDDYWAQGLNLGLHWDF